MRGRRLESDEDLQELLRTVRTLAVAGLSPHPHRDSHRVAAYLQAAGYRIIPVHPAGGEILGETVHPGLDAIPRDEEVDLVNVFRRPDALPSLVSPVVEIGPRAVWLQLGVTHPEAEEALLDAGMDLVVNRCMLVEHRRLAEG